MKVLFASDLSFGFWDDYEKAPSAESCMADAAKEFRKADFSIVNLENIFGNPKELTPIVKSGPNLISDAAYAEYLDVLQPTAVGLANNHCGDFGEKALYDTAALLTEKGYQCIGAGKNIDAAYKPAVLEKDGMRVAIFAVCENEFGVATKNSAGSAGYNLTRVTKAILSAREEGMIPIIYFHGGNEQNPFPSPGKTELYRHFADIGAGAVIAMHTHCPQGYEMYRGCPIVYSMGNFFFPANGVGENWGYGYMTVLDITEAGMEMHIIPYRFDTEKHQLLRGEEKEHFLQYMQYINEPIADAERLQQYFDSWCMLHGLNDYIDQVQYSETMLHHGAEKSKRLKNIFSCEAHNELIGNTMKILYEERTEEAMEKTAEIEMLSKMQIPSREA